jgi:hypothetical protein
LDLRCENFDALARDVERASLAGMGQAALMFYRGIIAAELGSETYPHELFDGVPAELAQPLSIWRIRHLLRAGEVEAALPLIDAALARGETSIWPYAATAWRLTGDKRSEWLEGDSRLVQLFDLTGSLPPVSKLAHALRGLHLATGEYLDQSVRGGTQTDGPLFSRMDPVIRTLRNAIVAAVAEYIGKLPPSDEGHPLLRERRDRRIRFSGSWSVRLRGGGRHANHVHPHGWISSALYVTVPDKGSSESADAGWFTLGEPPEDLQVELPPWKKVEPRPARLVLFPSWMWHGTLPFQTGERLTVAFDVRPPI